VHSVILWTVVGSSLLLAAVGAAMSGLNRVLARPLLAVTALAEVTAVVQSAVAAVQLGGHHVVSTATFVGYLIGNVLVLPIAVVWAFAERNRWAGAVMALGGLTVAVMTARLQMMWLGRA
jgi:hypothetical protein